jgi:DNA-binding transcriptional LysR family regulator
MAAARTGDGGKGSATPRYTLRQLEYFVAVAEAGSVTGAAQAVHLSQSALSTALVELERALDVQLLLRHHAKGVTLTAAGRQLLVASRRLLKQAAELADEARGLGEEITGRLDLACFGVLAPYILPELLAEAAVRLPLLQITTSEVDLAELVDGVAGGRYELAIGYDLVDDPRLVTTRLCTLRPYVLLPHGHRLVSAGRVELAELVDDPLALLDLPHSRDYFVGLFQSAGLSPTVRFRSTSAQTCRALVARGLAYTILNAPPRDDAGADTHAGIAVEIADEAPSLDVALMRAAGVRPPRRLSAVAELVDDLVARGAIASIFGADRTRATAVRLFPTLPDIVDRPPSAHASGNVPSPLGSTGDHP